ncbi:VPLPA-CTERM sorting domain-containing protein [Gymnodinialimonas sp. 2305UL16-5]|uniref:VPLPA-CTERM sorting domain-containing protein n=1 Tax=Gymnodinialimonas mytili TaxID=3126503 RepID=UPI0030A104EC
MIRFFSFLMALVIASQAGATVLREDFSGGLNGWSTSGAAFGIEQSGGPLGAGDAFMFALDNENTAMATTFGNGWSGDLSVYNHGKLSFDFIHTNIEEPTLLSSFGRLYVNGTSGSVHADTYSGSPGATWTSVWLGFDANAFNTSESNWQSIIADVTSIELRLESWAGNTERVGLDNAQLAPVPLPQTAFLLLASVGGLFIARRRSV